MNQRGVEGGEAALPPGPVADAPYVVLRHTGQRRGAAGGDHYDLLVDLAAGGAQRRVWTWRIFNPIEHWGPETPAERIADHRIMYMTYEGEISGGRGAVRRVAAGTAVLEWREQGLILVRLGGLGASLRLPM